MQHLETFTEEGKKPSLILEPWETDTLIAWFMYRLGSADRTKLMAQLPCIYNKLTGVCLAVYVEGK